MRVWVCVFALMVAACQRSEEIMDISEDNSAVVSVEETPAPTPEPHYEAKDGDAYVYTGVLGDGAKSTRIIQTYRFLGKEGDVYRIEAVDNYGSRISVSECSVPCRVVKELNVNGTIERAAVYEGSIIDVAFQDAANGLLERVSNR